MSGSMYSHDSNGYPEHSRSYSECSHRVVGVSALMGACTACAHRECSKHAHRHFLRTRILDGYSPYYSEHSHTALGALTAAALRDEPRILRRKRR